MASETQSSNLTHGRTIVIVIVACMSPNLNSLLESPFGQPTAQIYYDAVGQSGAIGLMSLLFVVQFLMDLSITVAASRQTWAIVEITFFGTASIFQCAFPTSKQAKKHSVHCRIPGGTVGQAIHSHFACNKSWPLHKHHSYSLEI